MPRHTLEDTRADLLRAATAEFTARGLRGTSLADIAKRAGYSKATVLYHFESKEQLVRVWSADLTAALNELAEQIDQSDDLDQRQQVAAQGFIEIALKYRETVRLMQAEIPYILGTEAVAGLSAVEARLRAALTRGDTSVKSRVAAVMFIAGVAAVADQLPGEEADQVREALLDQVAPLLANYPRRVPGPRAADRSQIS